MSSECRIAMWSGPRNISTALMRSFENREDCFVSDEPFYAFYLKTSGVNHPLREEVIASGEPDWNKITGYLTGTIPRNKNIWYQKHMAQHNLPGVNLDWIHSVINCLLIRDPARVVMSYAKKLEIASKEQLGFPQQMDLFEKIFKKTGKAPIILDSADILKNPRKTLQVLCEQLGIPFSEKMLAWPPGKRSTDGAWGSHWYGNVEQTTGFQPFNETAEEVPARYEKIYSECMVYYQQLYQHRIY